MTEAAALIGATQPALSRTVARLEARLGEPLFVRGRRPLQPTPLGRALAEQGSSVRLFVDRAVKSVEASRRGESGVVRIGGTPFLMDALISGMTADFQTSLPGVRIDQSYGYTAELVAKVRSGFLDLAICPIEVLEADGELAFEELLPGRNVIACRAEHPLLRACPLTPAMLLDYAWIEPPPGSPLHADLRAALLALGADRIRIAFSGGSLASIVNYLHRSDSLTVLPHSVVLAMRETGGIAALALELDHPPRALGILRAKGRGRSLAADRFAEHLKAAFAALGDVFQRRDAPVSRRPSLRANTAAGSRRRPTDSPAVTD